MSGKRIIISSHYDKSSLCLHVGATQLSQHQKIQIDEAKIILRSVTTNQAVQFPFI